MGKRRNDKRDESVDMVARLGAADDATELSYGPEPGAEGLRRAQARVRKQRKLRKVLYAVLLIVVVLGLAAAVYALATSGR